MELILKCNIVLLFALSLKISVISTKIIDNEFTT